MTRVYCDRCCELIRDGELVLVRFTAKSDPGRTAEYEICRACCGMLAEMIDPGRKQEPENGAREDPGDGPREDPGDGPREDPGDGAREDGERMDWDAAISWLNDLMKSYKGLGWAGSLGLAMMRPLKRRVEAGERSQELYDEIMELE